MTTTAATQLDALLTSLTDAPDRGAFAALWAEITDIRTPDWPTSTDGFSLDLPPGVYWNGGALYVVAEDATTAYSDRTGWPWRLIELWSEIEYRYWDERKLARQIERGVEAGPARRPVGRPAIGDPRQVRFPDWVDRLVTWYADEWGIQAPEAVRRLVIAGLHAERQRAQADDPVARLDAMIADGTVEVVDIKAGYVPPAGFDHA